MAKKLGLDLGKREIKPAKIIEETHAVKTGIEQDRKCTQPINRKKRSKKDWIVKSVRLEEADYSKIETHMKEKNINFNALIFQLLEEKGIV